MYLPLYGVLLEKNISELHIFNIPSNKMLMLYI